MTKERKIALIIGILGFAAIIIQMYFSVSRNLENGKTIVYALNHYFSYFTILTNTALAVLLLSVAIVPSRKISKWFGKASVSSAFLVYILVVGIVYYVLLLNVWKPTGLEFVANHILHGAVPCGYAIFWFKFRRSGALKFSQTWAWLWYPGLYFIYLMIRGAILGVYPYFFVDVARFGLLTVLLYSCGILAFFKFLAYLLVRFDRAVKSFDTEVTGKE